MNVDVSSSSSFRLYKSTFHYINLFRVKPKEDHGAPMKISLVELVSNPA